MVIETKETFEPDDIITLELKCKKCGAITVLPFNDIRQFSQHCANCGLIFIRDFNDDLSRQLTSLQGSVTYFSKQKEQLTFSLKFSLRESK